MQRDLVKIRTAQLAVARIGFSSLASYARSVGISYKSLRKKIVATRDGDWLGDELWRVELLNEIARTSTTDVARRCGKSKAHISLVANNKYPHTPRDLRAWVESEIMRVGSDD